MLTLSAELASCFFSLLGTVSLDSRFGRKDATSATKDLYSGLVTHMTRYLQCRYYKIAKNRLDSHKVVGDMGTPVVVISAVWVWVSVDPRVSG